jgi:hypothetical protein
MSFLGSLDDAKANAKKADMQIDGLETSNTSPVRDGSTEVGGAPLSGKKEFSTERTRPGDLGQGGGMRRAYPETKASK